MSNNRESESLLRTIQAMNREKEGYMALIATLQTENDIARGRVRDLEAALYLQSRKADDKGTALDAAIERATIVQNASDQLNLALLAALWSGGSWDDVTTASANLSDILSKVKT